jgi:hypothetical protein
LSWDSIERWSDAHLKENNLLATICRLCFGATIYHIWRHRNDLLHGNLLRSEEALVHQVKRDVRLRLLARCLAKKIRKNLQLVENWSLQPLLSM